ncbi:hypothetical protein BDQ12DRAFT_76547 [Crucibulum laeve]|uniref:Uncharacterized protein n=1 Tax=Crucibulum laeve TaxID=68775 RepID=A0A5C3M410_9AGAR|nr:hypothetical protein BDQ12DRAFT_76547 [Crucibulum laeve]
MYSSASWHPLPNFEVLVISKHDYSLSVAILPTAQFEFITMSRISILFIASLLHLFTIELIKPVAARVIKSSRRIFGKHLYLLMSVFSHRRMHKLKEAKPYQ